MRFLFFKIIFLLFFLSLFGQYGAKEKCLYFETADTIILDSTAILPSSLKIYSNDTPFYAYDFIFNKNKVIFRQPVKNIKVCFTQIPLPYSFKHKDTNIIMPILKKGLNEIPFFEKKQTKPIAENELNAKGILKRGVTAGNNTDVVMNSLLDLTVDGKLTDNLNIKAKIKDNDTPVQPDGTTTTLRDFGEVFLEVYDSLNSFKAGDVTVVNSFGDNLKITKSVKGLFYAFSDSSFFLNAGTSITKGIFRRQEFCGNEGNQGPYKLNGKNGEIFVLIVAGTERVFVDGKLKTRGIDKDYTIDYNAAEITFTANCPINGKSRIIVEFQYTRKFYPRFFSQAEILTNKKNFSAYFGYYSQNDAKNQSVYPLTDDMKFFLANMGDSIIGNYYPSFDTTNFDKNKILYIRKDTIADNTLYNIFVYSDTAAEVLYNVSFAYVGEGKGDYVLEPAGINGTVYKWVAPKNGKHTGSYMPGIILQAPAKKNIALAGAVLKINNIDFKTETYFSEQDMNTFSPLNDADNKSFSQLLEIRKTKGILTFDLNYSFVKKNFAVFEPFRTPEFVRDWNLDGIPDNNEHFLQTSIKFMPDTNLKIILGTSFLKRFYFKAFRNNLNVFYIKKHFGIQTDFSLLRTFDKINTSTFSRIDTRNFFRFVDFETGLTFSSEDNRIFSADTLDLKSFAFYAGGFYFRNIDTQKLFFIFSYEKRFDFLPKGIFYTSTQSDDYVFKFKKNRSQIWKGQLTAVYRRLKIIDATITDEQPENTLLFQTAHNMNFKGIKINLFYSYGGGLERKRKYVFVEVPPSKGNYAWIDYNGNGIKEENEFEPAKFPDMARFVRISYQTDEYVKVFYYIARQTFVLTPAAFLKKNSFFFNCAKALEFTSALNTEKKLYNNNFFSDTDIVYSHFMSFNNQKIKILKNFSLIFSQNFSTDISALINGNEEQNSREYSADFVFNGGISNKYTFRIERGAKNNFSEFFTDKNYEYNISGLKFTALFDIKKISFRSDISYFTKKSTSGENLKSGGVVSGVSFYAKEISLNFQVEYKRNIFDGSSDSPLGYSMLEGLQPGNNFIFSASASRKIFGNVNSQIVFQGRNVDTRLIFSGMVNFSVLF